jgi:IMP dehydrogenase
MRFKKRLQLGYDDVLLVPQYSTVKSRSDIDLSTKIGKSSFKLPIISSNMDTITNVKMAHKMARLGGLGLVHRYMSVDDQLEILHHWPHDGSKLGLSFGTLKNDKKRIDATIFEIFDYSSINITDVIFCVDIAHGDSKHMVDTIQYIRKQGWTGTLMAGATCTYDGTKRLLDAGADIVRVGVGPGSACSTRTKTGCGFPQFSAVMECAQAGPIIADGGIRTAGDAAKALGAGATAVMIGGMLAGSDCVPGWDLAMKSYRELTGYDGGSSIAPPSVKYRGMASSAAREAFGQKGTNAEGISCTVKAKPEGSTENIITDLDEGIRSAMSYSNSRNLNEFHERAEFIRVSASVIQENAPHILNNADAKQTWST